MIFANIVFPRSIFRILITLLRRQYLLHFLVLVLDFDVAADFEIGQIVWSVVRRQEKKKVRSIKKISIVGSADVA